MRRIFSASLATLAVIGVAAAASPAKAAILFEPAGTYTATLCGAGYSSGTSTSADFNSDGHPDLAISDPLVVDVYGDGDGRVDLAVASGTGSQLSILRNVSTGPTTQKQAKAKRSDSATPAQAQARRNVKGSACR